jgi:ABC-type uncharacterized transport system substrate-binding protein
MPRSQTWPFAGALAMLLGFAAPAAAHPHVFIIAEATVLYSKGTFTGLQHKWTFDEFYTAMAIEGLDKNKDGKYDREELAELAKVNIDGLKDFSFFTYVALGGQELKLGEVTEYWLEHKDGILSLHFTVPFAQPVLMEAKGLGFFVSDPTFFIAFELAKADPVKFSKGTPAACKVHIGGGAPVQPPAANQTEGPQPSFAFVSAKSISIDCGAP